MKKRKKVLVGYTWKEWKYWFRYESNEFLCIPEIIKNKSVRCLVREDRVTKVRMTVEEI